MTKSQVDRLGERLKRGPLNEQDLRTLEAFRDTFLAAHQHVIALLRTRLKFDATGRLKTTGSIVDKLRRESVRLSQIQDVAGCRVVVEDYSHQEVTLALVGALLHETVTIDRRKQPSRHYRAVHVIAWDGGNPVEIQIGTSLQHLWANLSEKFTDVLDPSIKYGGGPSRVREILSESSQRIAEIESVEEKIFRLDAAMEMRPDPATQMPVDMSAEIAQARAALDLQKAELIRKLNTTIAWAQRLGSGGGT